MADEEPTTVAEWLPFPKDAPPEAKIRAWCLCLAIGMSGDAAETFKNARKAESFINGNVREVQ